MPLRKDNLKIILFQLVILPFLFSCNSSSSSSSSTESCSSCSSTERSSSIESNSGSYLVRGGFGLFANGGNGVKYSNFELYLMGLIQPCEVEDIVYFDNVTQSSDDYNNRCSDGEWCPIFHSTSKKTLSITQLEQNYGKRDPDSSQSQKSFNAMVMMISKTDLTQSEIVDLSDDVNYFENASENSGNFARATGSRASLTLGNLTNSLIDSSTTSYTHNNRDYKILDNGNFVSVLISDSEYSNWNDGSINYISTFSNRTSFFEDVYKIFNDDFDFVIILHNNASLPSTFRYYGVHWSVISSIKGISKDGTTYDVSAYYGSSGKLKFVIHIPFNGLRSGPTLHEIFHHWGNYILDSQFTNQQPAIPHWGFSSACCQLGGFEKSKLEQSSTARSVHSKKTYSQLEISKSSFYDLDVLNYED